ncbi:MAG: hypothetical protein ACI32N_03845 [Bulleidia sp.]
MKRLLHCRRGFVSSWFLLILMYVCIWSMIRVKNVTDNTQILENMKLQNAYFIQEAPVLSDIRCRLKQPKDEEGNLNMEPYDYDETQHVITAWIEQPYKEMLVIELDETETYIESAAMIRY